MGSKKKKKGGDTVDGTKNAHISINRMNSLPIDQKSLTELIIRTVR